MPNIIKASDFPFSLHQDWTLLYTTTNTSLWANNAQAMTSSEWNVMKRSSLAIQWVIETSSNDSVTNGYTFTYKPLTIHYQYMNSSRAGSSGMNGFYGYFYMPVPGQPFKQLWVWIPINSGKVGTRKVYSTRNFSGGTYTQASQGAALVYPEKIWKIPDGLLLPE